MSAELCTRDGTDFLSQVNCMHALALLQALFLRLFLCELSRVPEMAFKLYKARSFGSGFLLLFHKQVENMYKGCWLTFFFLVRSVIELHASRATKSM